MCVHDRDNEISITLELHYLIISSYWKYIKLQYQMVGMSQSGFFGNDPGPNNNNRYDICCGNSLLL